MIGDAVNFLIVHVAVVIPLVLIVLLVLSKAVRGVAAGLLRVAARLLLIAAVIALVYDGTRTLAGGSGIVITSLADHWQNFHPASLASAKSLFAKLHPLAWDQGVQRLVRMPAWIVIGGIGLLFAWIGRKRRQINVFAN